MLDTTITNPVPAVATDRDFRPRLATALLVFSMFSTGASGLVSEYILATVSTYILGNSIEQFSVIIGLMLFMMGVAAWTQKFTSDRLLVEKFVGVEVVLAILGGIAPMTIYAAYAVMENHFNLVLYGFVMVIGFLIGFEIPVILRINERYSDQLKTNVGSVLSADYIGCLAGAFVWTYVLLRHFPLTQISIIVASFNFVVAVFTYLYFRRHGLVKHDWLIATGLVATIAVLSLFYLKSAAWSLQLEQKFYGDPIVHTETSKYQHLVMTHDQSLGEYRLYINGNTQFSSVDEAIYHEHLVHPAMATAPRRENVLILGGGDGLALREVLKYSDVRRVTLVDLDPAMTRFAANHPIMRRLNGDALRDARVRAVAADGISSEGMRPVFMETGKRDPLGKPISEKVASVEVINLDADRFLDNLGERYDVVIIDFPDPNSVELAKLYSKEFYLKLRRRVALDGVVVVQSTSPYHAKEAYLCILRTLEAAGWATLPYHDNVPSFGDWGWILARNASVTSRDQLRAQALSVEDFRVETAYLTPDVFRSAMVFGKSALTSAPEFAGKINTLMEPALLHLYTAESWKVE